MNPAPPPPCLLLPRSRLKHGNETVGINILGTTLLRRVKVFSTSSTNLHKDKTGFRRRVPSHTEQKSFF